MLEAVKDFVTQSINNNTEINNRNPLVYAIKNGYSLEKINVMQYVKDHAKEIASYL